MRARRIQGRGKDAECENKDTECCQENDFLNLKTYLKADLHQLIGLFF